MSNEPTPAPGRLSRLLNYLVVVACANTVIAALLTGLSATKGPFFVNFVYSQSIGLSILALTVGPVFALRRERSPGRPLLLGVFAIAVPLGFLIGSELASWMLGLPSLLFRQDLDRGVFAGIVLLTILAATGCSTFFWTRERVAALQLEAARERELAGAERMRAEAASRQATEAQLGLIRAQLEPHMLFNTLANLRSLITTDPPRAQRMMDRLISYLRATLSASRHDSVPLAAEFELLRDYLELIAIRMGPRLRYTLDLPPALAGEPVLPMLLQPLVENAVRHALEPAVEGGTIEVCATADGATLCLVVEDTGVGFDGRARSSGGGFGLEQVRERLRTAHGDAAGLVIESPRPMTAAGQAPGARLVLTMPRALSPAAEAPLIAPSRTTAQMPGPHPSGPYGSAPHGSPSSGLPGTAASPTATSR
ncbi:MAG: histidine kinase [Burkholderiaceae bacterium]